jgi:hypothetical protein
MKSGMFRLLFVSDPAAASAAVIPLEIHESAAANAAASDPGAVRFARLRTSRVHRWYRVELGLFLQR